MNRDRQIDSFSPGELEGSLSNLIKKLKVIYKEYPNAVVQYNKEEYHDTFGNTDTYFSLDIINPSRRKK